MSAVDDLITALDDGTFEAKFEGVIGGLDKAGLAALKADMESRADAIGDQQNRHLFKNGISSLQMLMDSM